MAIEIVELPMKNSDFPLQNVSLPEGIELCLTIHPSSFILAGSGRDPEIIWV